MKRFVKTVSVCFISLSLAACGGGNDGNDRSSNSGSSNAGNSGSSNASNNGSSTAGGTAVANRTGDANYAGSFTAKASPQGTISSGGKTYKGGDFKGRVTAEADFDDDTIDVDLVGTPKANVIDRYEAEFDDARISGGKFSGQGRENISANGGTLNSAGRSQINGSFNTDGSKISGKTKSQGGLVNVETDFSASER